MTILISKHKKALLSLAILILILSVLTYYFQKYGFQGTIEIIQSQGLKGMFVYVAYVILSVIFSPLNSLLIMPVALLVYGFWPSVILAFVGGATGGTVNYLLARKYGRPLIKKLAGENVLIKVDEFAAVVGWKEFLLLRIVGVNYFDYVSYAAGIAKMQFKQYILITYPIELVWKTVIFFLISQAISVHTIYYVLLIIFTYFASIYAGYFIWRQYKRKKRPSQS